MEYLFDPDKPHFKVWLSLYDMDTPPSEPSYDDAAIFSWFVPSDKLPAAPLYYAALCRFRDLVKHLVTKHPQDVNADGGYYMRPILAALAGEYFQMADLLRHNGADPHVRGYNGKTPLHFAANRENLEHVKKLIGYDADINSKDEYGYTPLHLVSTGYYFKDDTVFRLLLEHSADVNARTKEGLTPLHVASAWGALEVVRLLIKHGADLEAKKNDGETALQDAAMRRHNEIVELLREHGAK